MSTRLLQGDCRTILPTLADESVHCVVTSPPYWGLRDFGGDEQLGLEPTPEEHVANMVEVFREVRRVLRHDGVLFLNYGDSYQDKQLVGMPWRVAFALQADGWWLRQDIIWHKPNPMPESVRDRCTKAHEYLFLLAKSKRYYFDVDAIREQTDNMSSWAEYAAADGHNLPHGNLSMGAKAGFGAMQDNLTHPLGRNKRSVWTIATAPFSEAHFATFPPALVEPCIKAGCPVGGTVLDPFAGAGTVGLVADRLGRDAILIELNPAYAAMASTRIEGDAPLFAQVVDG